MASQLERVMNSANMHISTAPCAVDKQTGFAFINSWLMCCVLAIAATWADSRLQEECIEEGRYPGHVQSPGLQVGTLSEVAA